jgi:hypothetical protein
MTDLVPALPNVWNQYQIAQGLEKSEQEEKLKRGGTSSNTFLSADDFVQHVKDQLKVKSSRDVTREGLVLHDTETRAGLPGFQSPSWKALHAVFQRPWFRRI